MSITYRTRSAIATVFSFSSRRAASTTELLSPQQPGVIGAEDVKRNRRRSVAQSARCSGCRR